MEDIYTNGSIWASENGAHSESVGMSISERSLPYEQEVLTSEVVDNRLSADLRVRTLCSSDDASVILVFTICAY